MMVKFSRFWQNHWDSKARHQISDYELDRGSALKNGRSDSLNDPIYDFCDLGHGECLLDAGCGTGINIRRFGPQFKRIIGVDISYEMLKRAKKRIDSENLENSEVVVGTINCLGFKNDCFDKTICYSVLQYLCDEVSEAALMDLIRVSKENSVIIIHVKNKFSLYGLTLCFSKTIARLLKYDVIPEYYRPYWYYKNIMGDLGAQFVDSSSSGLFQVFFFPESCRRFLYRFEIPFKNNFFFKNLGVDCWMKFIVVRK
ncbi:ubiquinone/menaquinone biosynthesis C-methylase UbiE [Methanofollis sp. W23]|uniref:class I SAM-dependent methyltransferase n=1 Tax=Methanofollis sp. W23 TaxID=2817849 RepID=UPI001AE1DF7D|nr:class I SAM-dependent methyltransferase [Methanofollis sp. W23]MBP2144643.1 ubiquinone/menaquinone biosynthesis C-methylase UbiE [Methanofollis sp. W23]